MSGPPLSTDDQSQKSSTEEGEDLLDKVISRSGCAAAHYAVQECMAEHQDWRKCQQQVHRFKHCMRKHQKRRAEELEKLHQKKTG